MTIRKINRAKPTSRYDIYVKYIRDYWKHHSDRKFEGWLDEKTLKFYYRFDDGEWVIHQITEAVVDRYQREFKT